jgi:hypothetical protein
VLLSVLLARRVLLVFGSLGVFYYIGHLAWEVFVDSLFFPFVLSFVGIFIIALGVLYQRHQSAIEARVMGFIPDEVRDWLPLARG